MKIIVLVVLFAAVKAAGAAVINRGMLSLSNLLSYLLSIRTQRQVKSQLMNRSRRHGCWRRQLGWDRSTRSQSWRNSPWSRCKRYSWNLLLEQKSLHTSSSSILQVPAENIKLIDSQLQPKSALPMVLVCHPHCSSPPSPSIPSLFFPYIIREP